MQSGDFCQSVDPIKDQTNPIEPGDQRRKTPEIQASTSQYDQTNKLTSFEEFRKVSDAQLLDELMVQSGEEHAKNWTNIQRVPEVLQRNIDFKEYFGPMELSVGPLHAADLDLFKAELKLKLAARFVKESGHTAEFLFEEIKKNLPELKTSFDEGEINSYGDMVLARLLFLDGCAVLQFIDSYVNKSLNEFNINNGQADLIRQDLFLLENQIPFKVLKLLMDMKEQKKPTTREDHEDITKFHLVRFLLTNNLMKLKGLMYNDAREDLLRLINCPSKSEPVHLLDLLRSVLITKSHHDNTKCTDVLQFFCGCMCFLCFSWVTRLPYCSVGLSELLDKCILGFDYKWYDQQSFRNVRELKATGISLKQSDSCSLSDISFHRRWLFRGLIELPPLIVDGSTACKMLNLVAYEMCRPDYQEKCYVTSYINLLDLLIDDEDDVKDLRSAGILRNRLSTDMEVATLLNKIGSTCLTPPRETYWKLKNDIENHYKRKLAVWMAQVYHAHFSSPWTILALLAAVTVLLLTAIQTWYAIHPQK